mgnify:CR=1 FL=1
MTFKEKKPKVFNNEEEAKKYLSKKYNTEFGQEPMSEVWKKKRKKKRSN